MPQKYFDLFKCVHFSIVVFKVHYGLSFFYCFHFIFFVKDIFREFGFAFCVSEVFPMFFKSSVGSSYIKFVAFGACEFINLLLL